MEHFGGVFDDAGVVVVTHYAGMTVPQMEDLRAKMRRELAVLLKLPKTVCQNALAGTSAEGLSDLFSGPTAIAYSEDPVAVRKVVDKFAKENNKLVLLGGVMGETILDIAAVKSLAAFRRVKSCAARWLAFYRHPQPRLPVLCSFEHRAVNSARVVSAYAAKSEAA